MTLNIPNILLKAVRTECRASGINSIARYFIACTVTHIISKHRSQLIHEMANAEPADQDEIINYFLRVPLTKPALLTWIERTREQQINIFRKSP